MGAIVDSEDFTSAFNLVRMPEAWAGFLVYEKEVSGSVLGRDPEDYYRFAITTVPMGWSAAVAVIQAVVRRLVFGEAEVEVATEISKVKEFPVGPDFSLVYLDSFDFLRVRCRQVLRELEGRESPEHQRFVRVCEHLGLPLNLGKGIVGNCCAVLQGGEFDGRVGLLGHGRNRGRHLVRLSLGLASWTSCSEALLRHWAGLACFAATYRRPLYSILSGIFPAIEGFGHEEELGTGLLEEILVFASLCPLAVSNLRAKVLDQISCSDASPSGGGAATADHLSLLFRPSFTPVAITAESGLPCPGRCGCTFVSWDDLHKHRSMMDTCPGSPMAATMSCVIWDTTAAGKSDLFKGLGEAGIQALRAEPGQKTAEGIPLSPAINKWEIFHISATP